MKSLSIAIQKTALWMLGLLWVVFVFPALAQPDFEEPHPLKASEILPAQLRQGPFHRIDEKVLNDGYMNTYTLQSQFGQLKAVSTTSLKERIAELAAIDAMRRVEESDTFQDSVADAAETTVEGVKNIVVDPKGAISGAVTGIGKVFKRAGETIQSQPGAGEDSRFEGMIGYSNTKREYAYAFGVDVYSPNPILQEQLGAMAQAGYAGKFSVTALKALVPGGVGLALSVTGGTQLLNETIAKTPPTELRALNRDKLAGMNINPQLIDLFINTTVFSPRNQTLLVAALEQLPDTRGRSEFVKFAISTESEDLATFRTRSAVMYAVYNQQQAPIESFVNLNPFTLARTRDTLVFIVPVDHLLWTRDTYHILRDMDQKAADLGGVLKKQLWLAGTLSAGSRKGLKELGWEIFEKCEEILDWRQMARKSEPKS